MSEDLDVLIEEKESELSSILKRMEELKTDFIKETIRFAVEWYRKTAKAYVAKYSEVTLNMSEQRIAKMKAQFNCLIQSTEKTVSTELDRPALWWHQRPRLHDSVEQYLQVGDKYPEILDQAVRHVLGRLGLILEEHRFNVTTSSSIGAYAEFWFDKPGGENSESVPSYPHLLEWPEEMQETVQNYNSQYVKAIVVFDDTQKLKETKKRLQAMSRWDSI
jgi:hypothetical protein